MASKDEHKNNVNSLEKTPQIDDRKASVRQEKKKAEDDFGFAFVTNHPTQPKKHPQTNYGLKSIVLALNNMDNKVMKQNGIGQHETIISNIRKAVERCDKLLAQNKTTVEKMSPEERENNEASLAKLVVAPYVQEYVENPLQSIVTSAYLAADDDNPVENIMCVTANKRPLKVKTARDYYETYLALRQLIDVKREKIGQEISVEDVREDFKKLPGRHKFKGDETVIKRFKEIDKVIQFYAPRYKELLGEDPFKDLTQPEPAVPAIKQLQ